MKIKQNRLYHALTQQISDSADVKKIIQACKDQPKNFQ